MNEKPDSAKRLPPLRLLLAAGAAGTLVLGLALLLSGVLAPAQPPLGDLARAVAALENGDAARAQALLESLVRRYPDWTAARLDLALARLLGAGSNETPRDALDALEAIARERPARDPAGTAARFWLARGYLAEGRIREAAELLGELRRADPNDPFAAALYGTLLSRSGAGETAIVHHEAAVALEPELSTSWRELSRLYGSAGRVDDRARALREYERLEVRADSLGVQAEFRYGRGGASSAALLAPPPSEGSPQDVEPIAPPAFVRLGDIALKRVPVDPFNPAPPAAADLDGDGREEILLGPVETGASGGPAIAVVGFEDGAARLVSLLNTAAYAFAPGELDQASTQKGARGPDLFLAGDGWVGVLANPGGGFPGGEAAAPELACRVEAAPGKPGRVELADYDGDGDLDAAVLRSTEDGFGIEFFSNRGDGIFEPAPLEAAGTEPAVLRGGGAWLAGDWDADGDMDLLIFAEGAVHAARNLRGWRFAAPEEVRFPPLSQGFHSLAAGDLDGDGDEDIVVAASGAVRWWRNEGRFRFEEAGDLLPGGGAGPVLLFDFTGSLGEEALGFTASAAGRPEGAVLWSPGVDLSAAAPPGFDRLPSGPIAARAFSLPVDNEGGRKVVVAVTGDEGVEFYAAEHTRPALHVLLEGPPREVQVAGFERSNPDAAGARVEVVSGRRRWSRLVRAGRGPLRFGLPHRGRADCVRLFWPDGVVQSVAAAERLPSGTLRVRERDPFGVPPERAVPSMNRGIRLLEQYLYRPALEVFRRLEDTYPHWVAAAVNRGVAALNLQSREYLEEAEAAFRRALVLDADSLHARHLLGILLAFQGRTEEALEAFKTVREKDPLDPHAHYFLARTLEDLGRREEALAAYERALYLQPSFASAWYRLAQLYAQIGRAQDRARPLKEFRRLEIEGGKSGVLVGFKYGEGGKYSLAVRGTAPPGLDAPSWLPPARPIFGAPLTGTPPAVPPRRPSGRLLEPALALGDLDGDGALECVLARAARSDGPRLEVWKVESDGLRLSGFLPWDDGTCAAADLDGDGRVDIIAAGEGTLRAATLDESGELRELPLAFEGEGESAVDHGGLAVRLYVLDLDNDWDLDIACLRERRDGEEVVSRLDLFSQTERLRFRRVADLPFERDGAVYCELAFADWDGDVDLDLLLVEEGTGRARFFANDRVWRFRTIEGEAPSLPGCRLTLGADFDRDGDPDLLAASGRELRWWRNDGALRFVEDTAFSARHGPRGGTALVSFDFRNALEQSLLILDPRRHPGGEAGGGPVFVPDLGTEGVELPDLNYRPPRDEGGASVVAAPIGASGEPWLAAYDTESGLSLYPILTPGDWIALELRGPLREEMSPDKERSNIAGIGATVEVLLGTERGTEHLNTGSGGTVRSAPRAFFGLRGQVAPDALRILWPDAVLQSERGHVAGGLRRIHEIERKPTSCPILYAFNGRGFEFVADFLGVGGLGYFQAPGIYAQPDPTELLRIPRIAPQTRAGGRFYELRILEPLEECTYLDLARLVAVDHPADVEVLPYEMFAVRAPPPGFELLAFRKRLPPRAASDHRGRDVTELVARLDGKRAPELERHPRFKGFLAGTHALELDFGAGMDRFLREGGGGERLVLFLYGTIEYGSSTSNYAAWEAGLRPRAPSFLAERGGRWEPLLVEWGFPAGYPRWMAVDLTGLIRPGDRRLRIETNLEISWDTAFLARAWRAGERGETVAELSAEAAELRFRGFPRGPLPGVEGFPYAGFLESDHIRAFPGRYTRYGDVRPLLEDADDRYVVLGPGDELALFFPAGGLPTLEEGRTRSFFWKCAGYCKDMDPYTGAGERVEPLPFAAMPSYPYDRGDWGETLERIERAHAAWNRRIVEGGPRTPFETVSPAAGGRSGTIGRTQR